MSVDHWQTYGLSEEDWHQIDETIFNRDIIRGCKITSELTGLTLKEVIELRYKRHLYLREQFPDRFKCSHEDYYDGIYS